LVAVAGGVIIKHWPIRPEVLAKHLIDLGTHQIAQRRDEGRLGSGGRIPAQRGPFRTDTLRPGRAPGAPGTPTDPKHGTHQTPSDDLAVSGVVLMKGHPHHPGLHHHGLGDLMVSAGRVELLRYHSDEKLTGIPAQQVTVGTSNTLEEFGSILFVDFADGSLPHHETQWAIDFGLVNDVVRLRHPDGTVNHEKLAEYQALLSVEDIEVGIRYRQQFIDAVTTVGGRYEDASTSFENLIAKWPF
jgi:hypothetical protein